MLPYAGTSGWSGSDTSRERAERDDSDGTTAFRQRETLLALEWAASLGLTWKELGVRLGLHHGQASGVLSGLHKAGRIARLTERRDRCAIYVLHTHIHGRETAPHGGNKKKAPADSELQAEVARLRKKIERIEALVAPRFRSYSYTRDHLIDDIQRELL